MSKFAPENTAERIKTLQAEVECLRKVLAEKDKEIQHLKDLLNIYDRQIPACDCDENGVKWTERV